MENMHGFSSIGALREAKDRHPGVERKEEKSPDTAELQGFGGMAALRKREDGKAGTPRSSKITEWTAVGKEKGQAIQ